MAPKCSLMAEIITTKFFKGWSGCDLDGSTREITVWAHVQLTVWALIPEKFLGDILAGG